jgi:hypothetical protein
MARARRSNLDVARLARIVAEDQACRDLRLYFGVGLGAGELPPYAGGRFELLDGGGDRADVCNCFTASDIVALRLLSVELPARIALDLIEGALAAVGEAGRRWLGDSGKASRAEAAVAYPCLRQCGPLRV